MKAIVAVDKNWAIGKDGDLLFKLPGDMKYFRETTKGKVIVLGRKTLESFPGGKPLPGRVNVVLTRNKDYAPEGICVCHSLKECEGAECEQAECGQPCIVLCPSPEELEERIGADALADAYVCGGGEIYRKLIHLCDEALVTKIEADLEADTFFPNLDEDPSFKCVQESEPLEDGGITYRFTTYEQIK